MVKVERPPHHQEFFRGTKLPGCVRNEKLIESVRLVKLAGQSDDFMDGLISEVDQAIRTDTFSFDMYKKYQNIKEK